MARPKRSPAASRSGSHIPNSLRGTVRIEIRCSPDLAARARQESRRTGLSLAEILAEGVHEAAQRPRALTDEEEQEAARADAEHDRRADT
jgi:hypothetical protein